MRLLEGDGLIVMRLFGVGPVLGFQLKSFSHVFSSYFIEIERMVDLPRFCPRSAAAG